MALKFYADATASAPPRSNSCCVLCDSELNPCLDHPNAARYESGRQSPDYIEWRTKYPTSTWRPEWLTSVGAPRALETPIAFNILELELSERGLLHTGLGTMLSAAYDRNALATSKELERLLARIDAGSVDNPGGLLRHVLKGIAA